MSVFPSDNSEVVVQQTGLVPTDKADTRTAWARFVDAIRQSIGLKPIYLAERWAAAKVRQEEAQADATLIAAKVQYELAAARARKIHLQAEGQHAKDMAIARLIQNMSNQGADTTLIAELLQGGNQSIDDALANVEAVAQQIRLLGGTVEITVNEAEPETDAS